MKRLFLLAFILPMFTQAQLLEVKQVIYGMDCAPCARGVEASIKRLNGVQSVRMSLNDGTAEIYLVPDNRLQLQTIRQRIEDNGFTPKDATVKLSGILRELHTELTIETASGEAFTLQSSAKHAQELKELRVSGKEKEVIVIGQIVQERKNANDAWVVNVIQVR